MKTFDIPKGLDHTPPMIIDAYVKAKSVLEDHERPYVAVSGGKDSDVVMDIVWRLVGDKATYVFFDTGVEWGATKRHLANLEARYGTEIKREKAFKPVVQCVREYGQPFIAKSISHCLYYLQRAGFNFRDKPLEELASEYPRIKSYLRWWCNDYKRKNGSRVSQWNIARTSYLKDWLVANPLDFKVSDKCCFYAKKKTAANFEKTGDFDLKIIGVRRAEGGVRAVSYKNCYTHHEKIDAYRPLWWMSDADIRLYSEHFGIAHSDCYTLWGVKRTGCAGCPFNSKATAELDVARSYEPQMVKAMESLFAPSYRATAAYRAFKDGLKLKKQTVHGLKGAQGGIYGKRRKEDQRL